MVPLLPYVEQNNVYPLYVFAADWSDPLNANAVVALKFPLFRCPSSLSGDTVTVTGASWIGPGNNAFAPPVSPGAGDEHPRREAVPTGRHGQRDRLAGRLRRGEPDQDQRKTRSAQKPAFVEHGRGGQSAVGRSRGARAPCGKTGGPTVAEITDGLSNTILYSEVAARDKQCTGSDLRRR